MADSLIKRAKAFIGLEEEEGAVEEVSREELNVETVLRPKKGKSSTSAVYEIVIHEPKVYEDSLTISSQLRSGNPVVISLVVPGSHRGHATDRFCMRHRIRY